MAESELKYLSQTLNTKPLKPQAAEPESVSRHMATGEVLKESVSRHMATTRPSEATIGAASAMLLSGESVARSELKYLSQSLLSLHPKPSNQASGSRAMLRLAWGASSVARSELKYLSQTLNPKPLKPQATAIGSWILLRGVARSEP